MARAGRLNHRIEVQVASTEADSFGQGVDTWVTIATVWAGIEPLSSRELVTAQQTTSDATVRIVTRYSPTLYAVTSKNRLVHKSVIYDIEGAPINKNMSNIDLLFMCKVHDGR
jgi:SPP1 family predicted phage head-tail adaptor